ncbi:MAG: TonB family protein [Thermoanaerobaculia bacterium]
MSGIHAVLHALVSGAGEFLAWLFVAAVLAAAAGLVAGKARRLAPPTAYRIVSLAIAAPALFTVLAIADLRRLAHLARAAGAEGDASVRVVGELGAAGAVLAPAEWPCVVAAVWGVGSLLAVGRLAREHVRWRAIARRAAPLSLDSFERVCRRLGVRARLATSREIGGPLVVGAFSPAVLLPNGFERDLTDAELEAIFLHELAHVRRRDNLAAILHELVFSLAWFDPLHRAARGRLVELAERACDVAVLEAGGAIDRYLTALGKTCALSARPAAISCMSAFRLRERMDSIMNYSSARPTFVSHRAAVGFGLAVVVLFGLVFGLVTPRPSFAASAAAEESAKHTLHVTLAPAGEERVAVRVHVRAPGGETVMHGYAITKEGEPVELRTVTDERTYDVRVSSGGPAPTLARLEVFENGRLVETIETTVSPAPETTMSRQRPAVQTPDGVYRVGGDVKPPQILSRVNPIYPAEARAARISGIVIIETVISASGIVEDVKVLKGLPFGLDEAAAHAVRQWTFTPATLDGKAVPVIFNLTVNFRLGEEVKPAPQTPETL